MAEIYSSIVKVTIDAYSSIINNNMNTIMKCWQLLPFAYYSGFNRIFLWSELPDALGYRLCSESRAFVIFS